MTLDFIPQPHRLRSGKGRFRLPGRPTIGIGDCGLLSAARVAQAALDGGAVAVAAPGVSDALTIRLAEGLKPGGYRLKVTPQGITLEADDAAAAVHGARTLGQLVAQSPRGVLPALTVDDWPDFPVRGLYYDMARGRIPKRERLLEQAELLAHYKINHLQLYLEHAFQFRRHPAIGRGASPLSAEDVLAVDERCRALGVEFVPSLASFGHLSPVLSLPPYRELAEDWGVGRYVAPEHEPWWPNGWTLAPANPAGYEFLDELFAEFLPLFSSKQFNMCCDETWDLGWGQSHDLCRRRGKGRVYLDHLLMLRELAAKYGKRVMFWGDIIRHYPELVAELPKDAIVLDWGYEHNHPVARIADFKKAGLEFFACPGASGWKSLFPRTHNAELNIARFARAAQRHGAAGLLNTDWGDGGHQNFMEYSWPGYLFGAEQAWNVGADRKSFARRFCKLFLKIDRADVAAALKELGEIGGLLHARYLYARADDPIYRDGVTEKFVDKNGQPRQLFLDAKAGKRLRERLEKARAILAAHARNKKVDPRRVLPYWVFAADTLIAAARKFETLGVGGSDTPAARRALRKELTGLLGRLKKLWLARNHPSEMRITVKNYRRALDSLM